MRPPPRFFYSIFYQMPSFSRRKKWREREPKNARKGFKLTYIKSTNEIENNQFLGKNLAKISQLVVLSNFYSLRHILLSCCDTKVIFWWHIQNSYIVLLNKRTIVDSLRLSKTIMAISKTAKFIEKKNTFSRLKRRARKKLPKFKYRKF